MNTKGQNKQIGALMKDFVSSTIDFYNHMDSYPVCPPVNIENIHLLEAQPIPHKGRPLQDVYTEMLSKIYSSTLLGQHPRSFACVPSTASLLSWMGDTMTNAWNPHASCTVNAPAADLIEKKADPLDVRPCRIPEGKRRSVCFRRIHSKSYSANCRKRRQINS